MLRPEKARAGRPESEVGDARGGRLRSLDTALSMIKGFEAMLWLRKGFGFAGVWAVRKQNRLLGVCFGLQKVNEA